MRMVFPLLDHPSFARSLAWAAWMKEAELLDFDTDGCP